MSETLYKRLGGYDAIAAVVNDFMGSMFADKQVGRFYIGHSIDSKKRLKQLIVEKLCVISGGPAYYTGRDMRTAHLGLGITESDWQIAVSHLNDTLDKFNIQQREKDEVITAISGLKSVIVGI